MSNLERRLYNIEAFLGDIEEKYLEIGRSINDLRREINALKQEAHLMATAKPSGSRVIKNPNNAAYGEPAGLFSAFSPEQLVNATRAGANANQTFNQTFNQNFNQNFQEQQSVKKETPPKPQTPKNVRDFNPPKIETLAKTAPKVSTTTNSGGITTEYQNLVGMTGLSAKQARDSFVKKYRMFGVSCANIDERLQNINVTPVFEADDEPNKSHLWLVSGKNKYLAFLNPAKEYGLDLHLFAGFKDIFKSNYKEGTYTEFKSFKPAAFVKSGKFFRCETFGEIVF